MKLLKPFEIELSGINLVEASAGTGKTYNITSLYIRALIELDIPVGKILVVTYTEAATKELKDRLLERIRQSIAVLKSGEVEGDSDQFLTELLDEVRDHRSAVVKLEQAVRMFDEASIYTIHGFCYQALQEQAFESRVMYDAEMVGNDSELVQEAVDDYWRNWVAEASDNPWKKPLLKLLNERGIGPESLADELGSYIGKTYVQILPSEVDSGNIEQQVSALLDIYSRLQALWSECRNDLFEMLNTGHLSYYTENKLEKWFSLMDDFLESDLPPMALFTQFYRFRQNKINDCIKKKPKERGVQPPRHEFFQLIDQYREILESVKKFEIHFKKDLLNYLRAELNTKKEELQVLSYDDLLLKLRNALVDRDRGDRLGRKLCEKYPIAMVDEFQDTDPNQYDIFRRIYRDSEDTALFMIGDPKQSIYSFRGADVYSYLKARKDAPRENRYQLDQNFRSVPGLLRGFNILWGQQENPFVVDEIAYQKVTWGRDEKYYEVLKEHGRERPPIRFRRMSESGQERLHKAEAKAQAARDTVAEICRLLEGGKKGKITIGDAPVKAKDIAVLVRKHSQAEMISNLLQEQGIKSVRHSDKSVFLSEESEQLEQLLKALVEPANESLVKTALSLPLTGYTAGDILALDEDEKHWIQLLGQFSDWRRMWEEKGFAAMFQTFLAELNIAEHVIKYPDGERRMTNLLHLGELLQEESQYHREGTRSLLHWLARKRRENSMSTERDEEQMRLESDEDLVRIVTMHKSKGLQFPIVFCPFLWFGPNISDRGGPLEYHHPRDNDTTYLDLSGKSDPDRAEKRYYAQREELAEDMRLAYVAMTRAEHCLYLTWAFARASEFSSLGYLLQQSEHAEALLKAKFGDGESLESPGSKMHDAIGELCHTYPGLFTLEKEYNTPEGAQLELLPGNGGGGGSRLHTLSFERKGSIMPGSRISSFSSLTSWMDDNPDIPDYDQFIYEDSHDRKSADNEVKSMFSFPKGPQPGTCIHHIFEEINFSTLENADRKIADSFTMHGIDQEWRPIIRDMIETVVNKALLPNGEELKLSLLKTPDLVHEMEFYYRNEAIEAGKLVSIIREKNEDTPAARGKAKSGFMKGFIDLTFQYKGKFYLLDYKSNYLGDTYADYNQTALHHEMQEASYDLQYHIYTIALHRFLARKMSGSYDYEHHFGGVFYLFLRGMNKKGRQGIFFDRPAFEIIKELNQYILEGSRQ